MKNYQIYPSYVFLSLFLLFSINCNAYEPSIGDTNNNNVDKSELIVDESVDWKCDNIFYIDKYDRRKEHSPIGGDFRFKIDSRTNTMSFGIQGGATPVERNIVRKRYTVSSGNPIYTFNAFSYTLKGNTANHLVEVVVYQTDTARFIPKSDAGDFYIDVYNCRDNR